MGQGLTLTLCPIPLGYHRRQDGSLVHPADAEAIIRERAEQLTDEEQDEILSRTGNDDPDTYVEAIVEAWQTIMVDQHGDGVVYTNVTEIDLVDGGAHWVTGAINGGDYGCDEQEALELLDASGVCDDPMPWWEAPAETCGFPVWPGHGDPKVAALTCTLAPYHRGDKHGTTFNGCSISSVSKDLPEGIDPFPPVVIVYAGGDFSPYAEKHGCDPVVVIIDNGTKDGTEHDEWLDGIRQIAAGFPADHPAAVELLDFIDQEA